MFFYKIIEITFKIVDNSNLTLKLLFILHYNGKIMVIADNFLMQIPIGVEWIFIIIIIVVLFFGVKKIPELAKSFGKATAEFEKAKLEAKKSLKSIKTKIRMLVEKNLNQ